MKSAIRTVIAALALASVAMAGEPLTAAQKSKVEAKLASIKAWGSEAAIVTGVKERNANPPAKDMTQEKWKSLSVVDPQVRGFTQNAVAAWLKAHKDPSMVEIFVSGNDGTKVAFTAKTSNWSHKGKAKHDVAMTGKTWIGEAEMDESTGQKAVQVSFPVLDGGKAIGTVVVGLSLFKL